MNGEDDPVGDGDQEAVPPALDQALDQALAAFHQAMGGMTAGETLGLTPLDEAIEGLHVLYVAMRRKFTENEALKYMAFLGWKDTQ